MSRDSKWPKVYTASAMSKTAVTLTAVTYRYIARPIFFRFSSERVHRVLVGFGATIGRSVYLRRFATWLLRSKFDKLHQTVAGINFASPVGLAAGFDYQAELPEMLPALGFGFGSVGTFTLQSCQGNPAPQLGRLVRSRSLLVNKGFKNAGIKVLIQQSIGRKFEIPIGLSIGRTNAPMTEAEAITDIQKAFALAEGAGLPYAYYELNISCPNLVGKVDFYDSTSLSRLLNVIKPAKLSRPMFLKMPIELSDAQTLSIAETALKNGISTFIVGNLQKNRADPSLNSAEVARCGKGYFSGKPTWQRSNELIALLYRNYKKRAVIIGCGGTFSAEDAYTKIRLGATLIQLITGLVYVGPQLPAQINFGLGELLRRDGLADITQAIGVDNRS